MLGTITSGVAGGDTIMAFGALRWASQIMYQQVQSGQKPGYIFRSLQAALRMTLGLFNTCIAMVLVIVLANLRGPEATGNKELGWSGVALANTVSMGTSFTLLMTWWVGLEASMGSMQRILKFTRRIALPGSASHPVRDTGMVQQGRVTIKSLNVLRGYVMGSHGQVQVLNATRSFKAISDVSLDINPGEHVALIGRTGRDVSLLQLSFAISLTVAI